MAGSNLNPAIFEMPDIRNLVGKLSLTNYYQVDFKGFPSGGSSPGSTGSGPLRNHLETVTFKGNEKQIVNDLLTKKVGLLCTDASLPTSSFATAEVKDNFMGVTQEFAHTRLYTDADFTFYVDNDYGILRIFEGWMDFISGGGEQAQSFNPGYYRRFVYPDDYKISTMTITKFERNYKIQTTPVLVYTFINAFPKTLTPVPVSYGAADLLKVTVSFNYDRYIVERKYVNQDIELLQKQYERQIGSSQTTAPAPVVPPTSPEEPRQVFNPTRRRQGLE